MSIKFPGEYGALKAAFFSVSLILGSMSTLLEYGLTRAQEDNEAGKNTLKTIIAVFSFLTYAMLLFYSKVKNESVINEIQVMLDEMGAYDEPQEESEELDTLVEASSPDHAAADSDFSNVSIPISPASSDYSSHNSSLTNTESSPSRLEPFTSEPETPITPALTDQNQSMNMDLTQLSKKKLTKLKRALEDLKPFGLTGAVVLASINEYSAKSQRYGEEKDILSTKLDDLLSQSNEIQIKCAWFTWSTWLGKYAAYSYFKTPWPWPAAFISLTIIDIINRARDYFMFPFVQALFIGTMALAHVYFSSELRALHTEVKNLSNELDNLFNEIQWHYSQAAQITLSTQKGEVNTLYETVHNKENVIDALQKKYTKQQQLYEKEIQKLKCNATAHQAQLKQGQTKIRALQDEIKQKQEIVSHLKTTITQERDKRIEKTSLAEKLERVICHQENKIYTLQDKLSYQNTPIKRRQRDAQPAHPTPLDCSANSSTIVSASRQHNVEAEDSLGAVGGDFESRKSPTPSGH